MSQKINSIHAKLIHCKWSLLLQQIKGKYATKSINLFIVFIDLKMAYDSVSSIRILPQCYGIILIVINISQYYVDITKDMF